MAQLVDLNGFQKSLIEEGLKAVQHHFSEDIAQAKAEGKNHLFSNEFIEDTLSDIFTQLGIQPKNQKA